MIAYQLLGPIEAYAGDQPLPLGGRRQRAVLAALLLASGKAVSVRSLTEVVWDGCPPETARSQIQICVSALRRAGCPVITHHYGYRIDADPRSVDLSVYRVRVQEARRLVQEGRADEGVRELRAALALWSGEALAEIPGLATEATRLEEERLAVSGEVVEAELALGRHAAIIGELRSLVARHPLQERFRELLMVALCRCSRKGEALQQFYEARQMMVGRLGIEPGPELQRAFQRILADEPADLPAGAPVPHPSVTPLHAVRRDRRAEPRVAPAGRLPAPGGPAGPATSADRVRPLSVVGGPYLTPYARTATAPFPPAATAYARGAQPR